MESNKKVYGIVYKVTNLVNGKIYIGQTVSKLKNRISGHYHDANKHRSDCYFARALKKYNKEDWNWTILKKTKSLLEMNEIEIKYIKKYNTTNRSLGYNTREGGNNSRIADVTKEKLRQFRLGKKQTTETKMKISLATAGKNNPKYGSKHSAETKEKMRQKRLGTKHTKETKEKIRKAGLGKTHTEKTKKLLRKLSTGRKHSIETKMLLSKLKKGKPGHKHTTETKAKMSKSKLGRIVSAETRAKISATLKAKGSSFEKNNPMFGKKHSAETKRKMRLAKRNSKNKNVDRY